MTPVAGVLALQGDFHLHAELLAGLGVDVRTVRRVTELDGCHGLVIPGGESTTLQRLLRINGLLEAVADFGRHHPILGTCAGIILMSTRLENSGGVEPMGLLDIDTRRNGFGRQVDSFEDRIQPLSPESGEPAVGVFIRAPRILRVGNQVEVLAVHGQEPVAVRQGHHVGLTFHPELSGDPRWHQLWRAGLSASDSSAVA